MRYTDDPTRDADLHEADLSEPDYNTKDYDWLKEWEEDVRRDREEWLHRLGNAIG